jgi:hypothetical protein
MNSFIKLLFVNALLLLCAQHVFAKPIKVKIQGEQGATGEVAKSIAARLQGTVRYAVTDGDAELYLHLSCVVGKEVSRINGYICAFTFAYYPEKLASMETCLSPYGLVTGADLSSVAEDVFTSFVAATTDEKLERAEKDLRIAVNAYCHGSIYDKKVQADCAQKVGR